MHEISSIYIDIILKKLNNNSLGPGLSIDIGDLPALLEPFLKGKIDVIAKIIDATGNENICVKTTIELK